MTNLLSHVPIVELACICRQRFRTRQEIFLDRTQQTREAVLLTFCEPESQAVAHSQFQHLTAREWRQLLHWLDTSGLALYFLDRLTQLGQHEAIPRSVLSRLHQNLADNTRRTAAMMTELLEIHKSFQDAGLSYAMLKGFSLWPLSVPKLELRSQLDIDFLMAESSAPAASAILKARGYGLDAISGRSWEFLSGHVAEQSIKDLYTYTPQRSVELHLGANNASTSALLWRTESLDLYGVSVPVLSPVDLFLGQGLHVYKHMCSPCSRIAHHIEFRRHIIARYHDDKFWQQLRELAEDTPRAPAALGLVTLLLSRVMGDFAPPAFTSWTADRLPSHARLWVEMYGRRTMLVSSPGSKLYLLLQQAMEQAGVPASRPLRQALFPSRLPPAFSHSVPGETLGIRFRRNRKRIRHIGSRFYFHLVEGLRYMRESARWRAQIKQHTTTQIRFPQRDP